MEAFGFQQAAATRIAERFVHYAANPLMIDRLTTVPFLQTLVSITGSGKTLILADTIAQIRDRLPVQPVVLWISKGKIVVSQAYANLSSGKYADNLPGFNVKPLLQLVPTDLEDTASALLLVATVGKFAIEDSEGGDRKVFQAQLDLASASLWTLLARRLTDKGIRRPLIVVYDEGHNLSDLQTRRLLELAPDALISASATMALPSRLEPTINRLKTDRGWQESDFITAVSSKDVVNSGLVKERIAIGGYVTPMETAVDALLADMADAKLAATELPISFAPKAIYVCSTNTVDGVPISEDVKRPFQERQARPIQIWRHLVENAGIDPSKIVIYSQLKFAPGFPPPASLRLLSGGDNDYTSFLQGEYEHIIFNLGLQEGWDDPACSFAYIDKEMASARQITQVIGRVLRQPGAQHYTNPILNTAHFYIRSDERGVFDEILEDVKNQLVKDYPAVGLNIKQGVTGRILDKVLPEPPRTVPMIGIHSAEAKEPIAKIINGMIDFSSDVANTIGQGSRMLVLQRIGDGSEANYEWIEVEHSNRVTARAIFRRELQRLYSGALRRAGGPINLVDIELPKFDALVELTSPAADHIRQIARQVVETYISNSRIFQNDFDSPYTVGPVMVDPLSAVEFSKSLHKRYSGLNPLELRFAKALDKSQRIWARNPVNSGFYIPLLDLASSATYWPDFLVWVDKTIFAIDTKGDHLLTDATLGKLFEIDTLGDPAKLVLRLISEGEAQVSASGQIIKLSNIGYTVWSWKSGKLHAQHAEDERATIKLALG
ncbi:DEAD/DEAH box helicase family protein [Erythrobacter sp. T5W1-R]|uniref:DEAD/DEAH box helicase family protein n=1 Tax=Erythrobacter sp. T5W1-R TaxID=3101752 RepID=UPI002AFEDDD6|nr:DEAD/DEAH box helicase family protein [Erythrobacter sp. T5W1-R]MEA1618318.1 DEAD/DEAH box helicase family protein [Erythrobacter sp. T5W1-R]